MGNLKEPGWVKAVGLLGILLGVMGLCVSTAIVVLDSRPKDYDRMMMSIFDTRPSNTPEQNSRYEGMRRVVRVEAVCSRVNYYLARAGTLASIVYIFAMLTLLYLKSFAPKLVVFSSITIALIFGLLSLCHSIKLISDAMFLGGLAPLLLYGFQGVFLLSVSVVPFLVLLFILMRSDRSAFNPPTSTK